MKTRHLILSWLVLSIIAMLLVACGGGGSDQADTPTATTQPVDCKAEPDRCK